MSAAPGVDDLRLVRAVVESGSVGGAARALGITQPSASARLAAMERRCGARLFFRDTTGSRPTPAGSELYRQAGHILAHLDRVYESAVAASSLEPLRVGTFSSVSPRVVTGFEKLLDLPFTTLVDHGPQLVELVAESAIDVAVVGVAAQVPLPRGLVVTTLGRDPLVLLSTPAAPSVGRGRSRLRGRRVVCSTYDAHGPLLRERLEGHGARAELGPTLATSIALARTHGALAVIPRSVLAHDLREGEEILPLPFTSEVTLSLVTRRGAHPDVEAVAPRLGRWLHLSREHARAGSRGPR